MSGGVLGAAPANRVYWMQHRAGNLDLCSTCGNENLSWSPRGLIDCKATHVRNAMHTGTAQKQMVKITNIILLAAVVLVLYTPCWLRTLFSHVVAQLFGSRVAASHREERTIWPTECCGKPHIRSAVKNQTYVPHEHPTQCVLRVSYVELNVTSRGTVCRFLLACCGDGIVRVFNPHTGVIISVLVSKRNRNGEVCEGEAKGRAEGIRSKRASSILDGVELPCTCAAFRPHVRVRGGHLRSLTREVWLSFQGLRRDLIFIIL